MSVAQRQHGTQCSLTSSAFIVLQRFAVLWAMRSISGPRCWAMQRGRRVASARAWGRSREKGGLVSVCAGRVAALRLSLPLPLTLSECLKSVLTTFEHPPVLRSSRSSCTSFLPPFSAVKRASFAEGEGPGGALERNRGGGGVCTAWQQCQEVVSERLEIPADAVAGLICSAPEGRA